MFGIKINGFLGTFGVSGGGGSETLQQVLDNGSVLDKDNNIITDFHKLNIGDNASNFNIQLDAGKVVVGDNQFVGGNGNNITVDDNNNNIFIGKDGGNASIILDTGATAQIKLKSGSFPVILSTQELTSDVNRTYIDVSGKEVVTVLDNLLTNQTQQVGSETAFDYVPQNYDEVKKFEITPYLKIISIDTFVSIQVNIKWYDENNDFKINLIYCITDETLKSFVNVGTYLFPSTIINANCNGENIINVSYTISGDEGNFATYNAAITIKQLN